MTHLDKSILIVDDEPLNLMIISEYLQAAEEGYSWDTAENGEQALEILALRSFDIILMDLNMPVMGGIETTKGLRQLERDLGRPRSHVIAFTSSVLQDDIDSAIQAGCDSYLIKPLKKQKLINAIARVVRR